MERRALEPDLVRDAIVQREQPVRRARRVEAARVDIDLEAGTQPGHCGEDRGRIRPPVLEVRVDEGEDDRGEGLEVEAESGAEAPL